MKKIENDYADRPISPLPSSLLPKSSLYLIFLFSFVVVLLIFYFLKLGRKLPLLTESEQPFDEPIKFLKLTDGTLLTPRILNKSFIEVDENGVKAASATFPGMEQREAIKFICNRPFLFLIHDKDYKNIFFIGKYADPSNIKDKKHFKG